MALSYVRRALPPLLPRIGVRSNNVCRSLHAQIVDTFPGSREPRLVKCSFSPALLDGLPILLPLESEENRNQVFTHRSFYGRPTSLFEDPPNDPSPDNEFLEYIGDSILNMCSALLLKKMYPNLRVGPATVRLGTFFLS